MTHAMTPATRARRTTVLALLAAAGAALAIASCGGGAAKSRMKPEAPVMPNGPETTTPSGDPEAARARIETLDREIAARESTLGLARFDPGVEPVPMTSPATATCTRSPSPRCQDVCTLSDSICAAADEICKLAGALPGDAWASGRCTAGNVSCGRARERCCDC